MATRRSAASYGSGRSRSIYIDLGFLFSVNYALVRGIRLADGRAVQEQLRR
jgi:hypothetical protein